MEFDAYFEGKNTPHDIKYAVKSFVLNEFHDYYIAYIKAKRYEYLQSELPAVYRVDGNVICNDWDKYNRIKNTLAELEQYHIMINELYITAPHIYWEIKKLHDAFKARRQRLRRRIENMLSDGETYFVTLTFNNECLSKTSEETRRKYVTRFMDERALQYVGNIDYGDLNDREHYHVVFRSNDLHGIHYIRNRKGKFHNIDCVQFKEWNKYGFFSIEKCSDGNLDKYRLSVYVSKLSNHAIKNSTKQARLI